MAASNTTNNSSCCAGSNSQLTHRTAAKTKSDASTCTRDDSVIMDHNNNNKIINDEDVAMQLKEQQKLMADSDDGQQRETSNGHHQIIVTNVQIEANNNLDGNNNNDNYLIPLANQNNKHQLESIQRTRTKSNEQMPINGPFTNQLAFENQAYEADIEVNDDVIVAGGNLPVNGITVTTGSRIETNKSDSPPLIHSHNHHLYMDDNESLLPLSANIDTGIDYDSDSVLNHSKSMANSTPAKNVLKEDLNNNNINVGEFILTTPKQLVNNSSEENDDGEDADDDMDDENESDVSTTIIDGKRAISLSNFGKFAEQLEKRESSIHNRPVIVGPTFGYPMASAGYMKNASFAAAK